MVKEKKKRRRRRLREFRVIRMRKKVTGNDSLAVGAVEAR
jgi:hypothetical protein